MAMPGPAEQRAASDSQASPASPGIHSLLTTTHRKASFDFSLQVRRACVGRVRVSGLHQLCAACTGGSLSLVNLQRWPSSWTVKGMGIEVCNFSFSS